MQEKLDQECLDMLPLVKDFIIRRKEDDNYRNIIKITLIESVNSQKKLSDMNKAELSNFQHGLIKMFKYHGLTK